LLGNKSIIYELFKTFGVSAQLSKDLYDIINGKTGKHIYTNTHRILKNRNEIIVTPLMVMDEPYFVINSINDIINVPSIKSAHFVIMSNDFIIPSDKCVACLDADKLIFPLIIRSWKAGDYFCPLGMKKKKKLSDYFIDNKYSIPEKEKALIIESSGEIVCILGERIDDRFRTSRDTKKVLLIKVNGKC
jgi:tRNA(Ile)-lysidine synthase